MSSWFGEMTAALRALGGQRRTVDGEICVLNELGIAGDEEFRRLLRRQALRGFRQADDGCVLIFDALVVDRPSVMKHPLPRRKGHLHKLLSGVPHTLVIGNDRRRGSNHVPGRGRPGC